MADRAEMLQLLAALRGGLRVTILREVALPLETRTTPAETVRDAHVKHDRAERLARVTRPDGKPVFDIVVTPQQVLELLKAGASREL